jgi:hypothetical protein
MRQTTELGLDALIGLDASSSLFAKPDLRVDRLVEGIEVSAVEVGKWRKAEKVVTHKLGRYHVTRVAVGDGVSVRVEAADATPAGLDITVKSDGEVTIDRTDGEARRDVSVDQQNRSRLLALAEKLATAVRSLATHRTGLISFEVDGTPFADHAHPRTVAERLIAAMAPVVQQIRRHSPGAGELVLRVPLGSDRREEIFVSTAELATRFDGLAAHGKEVFAPLQLGGPTAAQPQPAQGPAAAARIPTGSASQPSRAPASG